MGLIRIFLALIVLASHLGLTNQKQLFMFNGHLAVESFYILSGFYMSLILNEKYIQKQKSYFLFISNRILRIYPIYFLILTVTFLVYWHHLPKIGSYTFYYIIKNLTIFWDPQYFVKGNSSVNYYLLVSQASTVGLEMIFYAVAPFILRSWKKILFVLGISIIMRYFGNNAEVSFNFFFFMLGSFSYLMYKKLRTLRMHERNVSKVFVALILLTVILPYMFLSAGLMVNSITQEVLNQVYYLAFATIIPFVFLFSSVIPIDRAIGDFSYPVYISHGLVLYLLQRVHHYNYLLYVFLSIILVFVVSKLLLVYVDKPVQAYRTSRVKLVVANKLRKKEVISVKPDIVVHT